MSRELEEKIINVGKLKLKEMQGEMFRYIVADYEFERNKAVGGILGGQERADEAVLKARDANEEELKEFQKGIDKINEEAKTAEDEYEKVVKGLNEKVFNG